MLHDEGVQHMAPLLKPPSAACWFSTVPALRPLRLPILPSRPAVTGYCALPPCVASQHFLPCASSSLSDAVRHPSGLTSRSTARPSQENPWGETPLGLAVARASRLSLLICGYWLDECITFTALNALGEGYDLYLLTDASPPLDIAQRDTAILRLVQAGVVPTTTKQVIREWTGEIPDMRQRQRLLALV
jgi:hypothetical protein